MKTNPNKFRFLKKFEFIKKKFRKEKQLTEMLNTELLFLNSGKFEHTNRINKMLVNTDFASWRVK